MNKKNELLKELLVLSPQEKALIIDELLKSLDKPDAEIDKLWKQESEARIDAYEKGQLKSESAEEVFSKYKKTR